ncbi:hypothetical protein JCM8097_006250 [Rhodosporidiobolus ruineniae]
MVQPRINVLKPRPNFMGFTSSSLARMAPSLALWGFPAVGALLVVGSSLPRFKNDGAAASFLAAFDYQNQY